MSLPPGSRLGTYVVGERIGAGAMGEVYRARDESLGRDVALKLLPRDFLDPDRRARFQREARILASLSHPNIATLYGLETNEDQPFLIMELVDGETLSRRLGRGPLSVRDALAVARQIAAALEAAHEKGVVHRDLKPANIHVTSEKRVKVLDFGLAKTITPKGEADSNAPTLSQEMTAEGTILGTLPYMSPEQVRGQRVDQRADIWAFGCVLYEMLTGARAFGGETASDTIASIIEREPSWQRLPMSTPAAVRRLTDRCLRKDPARRLRHIGDAAVELDEVDDAAASEPRLAPGPSASRGDWRRFVLAAWIAVLAAGALWWASGRDEMSAPVVRVESRFPEGLELAPWGGSLAMSPDGRVLVFSAISSADGTAGLYRRRLDSLTPELIAGTEGGDSPFFSPDGRWLGFYVPSEGYIKKLPWDGVGSVRIAEVSSLGGASWGEGDVIVYSDFNHLRRVSASGGASETLTSLRNESHFAPREDLHRYPCWLPDGRGLLFTIVTDDVESYRVAVLSLDTGEVKRLLEAASYARYLATGHLAYVQPSTGDLLVVPFDLERFEVTGTPTPVEAGLYTAFDGGASFDVSGDGTLLYASGPAGLQNLPVWRDAGGATRPVGLPLGDYRGMRVSPSGKEILFWTQGSLWVYDTDQRTTRRVTDDEGKDSWPIWTPDGAEIIFNSTRHGTRTFNLYRVAADGSTGMDRLSRGTFDEQPQSWASNRLVYQSIHPETGYDVWIWSEDAGEGMPILETRANEKFPDVSPDGRDLAYASDETGRYEVYVRPLSAPGPRRMISSDGGVEPVWDADGGALFFRGLDGQRIYRVALQPALSPPELVAEGAFFGDSTWPSRNWDISPRGELLIAEDRREPLTRYVLVTDWLGAIDGSRRGSP